MTAALRDRQLQRLCDAFEAAGPDAPTLCEGWDVHDLAVHIWQLGHDPLAWPGIALRRLEPLTAWRTSRTRRRVGFAELVDLLRSGSGALAAMPTDALEGHRHALGEYYMHTQDVVRANGIREPRPDEQLEAALWLRVQRATPILRGDLPGLVLRRPGGGHAQVVAGPRSVEVVGPASELIVWVYGREDVARVEVAGPR
ncbi:MAG: maleylpyruvate isomerase family mycothiol-dependent enzyme [Micrococcales bacterium]|nr:maleylpyruvate isomerase family mycothiol-dependent enzyme [Micrococcales bacterium]